MRETMRLANGLTYCQNEVYTLVLDGYTNEDIADILGLKEKTVKFHLTNIYEIMKVLSRAGLQAKEIKRLKALVNELEHQIAAF